MEHLEPRPTSARNLPPPNHASSGIGYHNLALGEWYRTFNSEDNSHQKAHRQQWRLSGCGKAILIG